MPLFELAALIIYLIITGLLCLSRLTNYCAPQPKLETSLLLIGLLLHGNAVFAPFANASTLHFGAAEALSLTAWTSLAIYLGGQSIWQLKAPLAILISFATVFLALSLCLPAGPALDYNLTSLARAHLLIAMLAYGMLTNAAAVALLMRIADRRLHHPKAHLLQRKLPPLLTLEKLMFLCLWLGFAFLSLTLISGVFFAESAWGHPVRFNHKTLFSFSAWCAFGSLLIGHHFRGWRGRFAANWIIIGYTFLILGYIGAHFILQVILHRN